MIRSFQIGFSKNSTSISDQRARDFFTEIENIFRRLYTIPFSKRLQQRTIRSIRHQLKLSQAFLRPTDKSKVFHLGSQEDHHQKAQAYMQKTHAYQELVDGINPLIDHLQTVLSLIDPLLEKKAIDLTRWKRKMRPDAYTVELAHLYFIPQAHKVRQGLCQKHLIQIPFFS